MNYCSFKNVTYKLAVYKSHIEYMCINKIWHKMTYKAWYNIKEN